MIDKAAARGVVDFAAADLRDVRFWRRLFKAVADLEARELVEFRKASLDVSLATYQAACALAKGPEGVQAIQAAAEAVDKAMEDYREALRPGSLAAEKASRKSRMRRMEEDWEAAYGPMSSPETQAKIEEACRALGASA